jgi:hypothetical protein
LRAAAVGKNLLSFSVRRRLHQAPQRERIDAVPKHQIGCKTMHDAVVVGSVFMAAGVIMMVVGKTLVPAIAFLDILIQGLGVLLLLFVPFILIATFLRTAAEREEQAGNGTKRDADAASARRSRPSHPPQ